MPIARPPSTPPRPAFRSPWKRSNADARPGRALIPVVTLIGLQLPILVGGAVNLFFATGVVVINLMIDLVYGVLDPRVRYE